MSDYLDERSQTIRSLQDQELQLKTQARALKKRLTENRRKTQVAIESEWTQTKDPSLSNATKRRVALDQRVENNEEYSLFSAQLESLELQLEALEYDIEEQLRSFQNDHARIIIRSQPTALLPAYQVFENKTSEGTEPAPDQMTFSKRGKPVGTARPEARRAQQ